MDDTSIQVFINNGATPSILPMRTFNKHLVLQKYPKQEAPHLFIQEVVQFLDRTTTKIGKPSNSDQSLDM